jgi:hypothetical protein
MDKDLIFYKDTIKEVLDEEKTDKKIPLVFSEANISINKRGSEENPSYVYTVRIPSKVAKECKIKLGDKIGFATDISDSENPKLITKIIKKEKDDQD